MSSQSPLPLPVTPAPPASSSPPLPHPQPLPATLAAPLATAPPPTGGPIQPQSHPHRANHRRPGGWLPRHQTLESWLDRFHNEARKHAEQGLPWHPVVKEVSDAIDADPIVRLTLTNMIEQVPKHKPYSKRHINSLHQLLVAINHVLHTAPHYDNTELVGAPLNAVLDFFMDTPAGYAAFRSATVNRLLGKVLTAWCQFLETPASAYVLHEQRQGWFCTEAAQSMNMDEFEHDKGAEHKGFKSWNAFFTRRFKPGMRPVEGANDDKLIVSACESTPYAIQFNVQKTAQFWIKTQPYSLRDMLDGDERVEQFVGGCIYQAFLSALFYHRWHSPVNGTVVETRNIPGTYYSEAETEGFDPAGPNNSQGYITHTATRALMFIQADDPVIGLMAILFVGVSASMTSQHRPLLPLSMPRAFSIPRSRVASLLCRRWRRSRPACSTRRSRRVRGSLRGRTSARSCTAAPRTASSSGRASSTPSWPTRSRRATSEKACRP